MNRAGHIKIQIKIPSLLFHYFVVSIVRAVLNLILMKPLQRLRTYMERNLSWMRPCGQIHAFPFDKVKTHSKWMGLQCHLPTQNIF